MKKTLPVAIVSAALIFSPVASFAASSLASDIAAYNAEDCAPVVEAQLSNQSVAKSNIKHIEYMKIYFAPGDFSEIIEYEGWVTLASCTGNLVVNMNNACLVQQSYTRGGCKMNGMPAN